MTDLSADLTELAKALLDEALDGDQSLPIDRKVDIFKAVSAFHLGTVKLKPKRKDADDDEDGIRGFDVESMKRALADTAAEQDLGL
jgi:hypothetical protein